MDDRQDNRSAALAVRGRVMRIQHFSVNDGEGIRSTVFLAGCPLRCAWCANPEGCTPERKVAWYEATCVRCGRCAAVCPEGIGVDLHAARDRCTACGRCETVCPTGSRRAMVRTVSAQEVLEELRADMAVFRQSGGGVTFSGGDPLQQPAFLRALTEELYDRSVHLAMETELFADLDPVMDILAKMDLLFVDIKSMDEAVHRRYTGVSNERILANVRRLASLPAIRKVIRVPVVAGVNDSKKNIRATAGFLRESLPEAQIELLPYHNFGESKYRALGLAVPTGFAAPSPEALRELEQVIREEGINTISYR